MAAAQPELPFFEKSKLKKLADAAARLWPQVEAGTMAVVATMAPHEIPVLLTDYYQRRTNEIATVDDWRAFLSAADSTVDASVLTLAAEALHTGLVGYLTTYLSTGEGAAPEACKKLTFRLLTRLMEFAENAETHLVAIRDDQRLLLKRFRSEAGPVIAAMEKNFALVRQDIDKLNGKVDVNQTRLLEENQQLRTGLSELTAAVAGLSRDLKPQKRELSDLSEEEYGAELSRRTGWPRERIDALLAAAKGSREKSLRADALLIERKTGETHRLSIEAGEEKLAATRPLLVEAARDFHRAGLATYYAGNYRQSVADLARAVSTLEAARGKAADFALWAQIRVDQANSLQSLGTRSEPAEGNRLLDGAVAAYRSALEVYTAMGHDAEQPRQCLARAGGPGGWEGFRAPLRRSGEEFCRTSRSPAKCPLLLRTPCPSSPRRTARSRPRPRPSRRLAPIPSR